MTLNQRVPGSSPGAPTNLLNSLEEIWIRTERAVCGFCSFPVHDIEFHDRGLGQLNDTALQNPRRSTAAHYLKSAVMAVTGIQTHIPTEVHFDFLGMTIPIHWGIHAALMVGIWFVLVPLCIITIRFGKPKPTLNGIREKVSIRNKAWWWFSVHKYGLMAAVGLALAGAIVALTVSGGFSGSLHSLFGISTITLGCLQVISGWFRGVHGGRNYYTAVPNDPATWRGDHYDMTPRRRKFEAYHKTAGYFIYFFAVGAVATGLMQYPIDGLAELIIAVALVALTLCVVLEYKGLRYDGYRAAHGYNLEHPYNKEREHL